MCSSPPMAPSWLHRSLRPSLFLFCLRGPFHLNLVPVLRSIFPLLPFQHVVVVEIHDQEKDPARWHYCATHEEHVSIITSDVHDKPCEDKKKIKDSFLFNQWHFQPILSKSLVLMKQEKQSCYIQTHTMQSEQHLHLTPNQVWRWRVRPSSDLAHACVQQSESDHRPVWREPCRTWQRAITPFLALPASLGRQFGRLLPKRIRREAHSPSHKYRGQFCRKVTNVV